MLFSMLFITIPLIFGYLIPLKNQHIIERITKLTSKLVLLILIFMGLSLAKLDNLSENINHIFILSSVFFLCTSISNLAILPLADKFFKTKTSEYKNKIPTQIMLIESSKLIFFVLGGLILGLLFPYSLEWVNKINEYTLLLLLFFIGIQLRNSGVSLKQIFLNTKGLCLASMVIFSSLLGGILAATLLDIPINYGLAMASGFGWYSLSGILITDAIGPIYGGASFIIELARELTAIIIIPCLIQRYPLTSVGYAGATAVDFTLPIIQSSGGVSCVPVAIVSGFILSLLVPVLILFFLGI